MNDEIESINEKINNITLNIEYRALYPENITGAAIRFYDYYNPEIEAICLPIKLEVTEEVKKYIVENEIDLSYGARQLKRRVQELIENKIANEIVEGNLKGEEIIEIYLEENQIKNKITK